MKLKWIAAAALMVIAGSVKAQNFPGYRSGNYTGVNGVFFNPANIADSRYRWDFNLLSFNGFAGNDKGDFKLKDLTSTKSDNFKNKFLGGNGNTNANLNVEVLGPSAMFNINKKSAMAVTTRVRAVANLKDFDGNLLNSVINSDNNAYPYNFTSTANSRIIANGWSEIGLSYAREIANRGAHYFKAGLTVKYLSGAANNYLQLNNIKTTINEDAAKESFLQNTTGTVALGNSGASLDNPKFDDFFGNGNNGIGGDLGLIYEYRPDYANSGGSDYNRDINKYKFKAAVSLMDVGRISYKSNPASSGGYNVHITGADKFYLNQLDNKSSDEIKAVLDANPAYFTQTGSTAQNKYYSNLPSVLQAEFDYHLHRGFFVSAGGQFNLISKSSLYSAHQYNSVTVTPRYEGKAFGVYFPLSYNELTEFNAGISLRAGPLFIGSGSIITAIAKSKQADVHVGLRFGILQKKKKTETIIDTPPVVVRADRDNDGVIDDNDKCPDVAGSAALQGCPDRDGDGIADADDKCPDVAGLAKYNGCPIPDTDGDGVNDELDKCPSVKGLERYQGCPIPDTDNDGVNDEEDKCPSRPGPVSNMGCPVIEKAVKDKINFAAQNIFFATGSAKLLPKSFKALDGVATLIKADETLSMAIDGHTDNTGKPEKNMLLSEQRAAAVKTYLVAKGIDAGRLTSSGYGITKPVADNKTAAGRGKNRRVEMYVKNY